MMFHRITPAVALSLALAAIVAPTAPADPQPLPSAQAVSTTHLGAPQANRSPCSDACSGGGLGAASLPASSPVIRTTCRNICTGRGTRSVSTPATLARVDAPGRGFDWGDAGIGAAGLLTLTIIATGGLVAAGRSGSRHTHTSQRATPRS
jgi:hypothetical protein